MFLLNLGLWDPGVLAVLVTWTTGLGAVGADMLLVMLGPVPVPATMPGVTNGIVAVVVMGVVVAGSVAAGPALPTGYKPML